MKIDNGQY